MTLKGVLMALGSIVIVLVGGAWTYLTLRTIRSPLSFSAQKLYLPLEATQLARSADMAAGYLQTHIDATGRFVYRVNPNKDNDSEKYNVVRHAGTIYALAAHAKHAPNPVSNEIVARATRYLVTRNVDAVAGHTNMSAVFSLPEEEVRRARRKAKLGGTALGIVALHAARELDPGLADVEVLRRLGRFILFMQQADGRFRSAYDEVDQFAPDFDSLYFPGEAILALTRLYRLDGDPAWLDAAFRGAAFLVRSRHNVAQLPNDHWFMIASEELLPLHDQWTGRTATTLSREALHDHVVALAKTMLREQEVVAQKSGVLGPFTTGGFTTPTSTRLEGLIAAYRMVPNDGALARDLRRAISTGMRFVLASQILDGPLRGGVPRARAPIPGASASFNQRQPEVRIDYVQHALSAMLGALHTPGLLTSAPMPTFKENTSK